MTFFIFSNSTQKTREETYIAFEELAKVGKDINSTSNNVKSSVAVKMKPTFIHSAMVYLIS